MFFASASSASIRGAPNLSLQSAFLRCAERFGDVTAATNVVDAVLVHQLLHVFVFVEIAAVLLDDLQRRDGFEFPCERGAGTTEMLLETPRWIRRSTNVELLLFKLEYINGRGDCW